MGATDLRLIIFWGFSFRLVLFYTATRIGLVGWIGIGLVTSGVYIRFENESGGAGVGAGAEAALEGGGGGYDPVGEEDGMVFDLEGLNKDDENPEEEEEGQDFSEIAPPPRKREFACVPTLFRNQLTPSLVTALSSFLLPIVLPFLVVLAFYPLLSHLTPDPSSSLTSTDSAWESDLYSALDPICVHDTPTSLYNTSITTGFVSFPRSGNSYLRSLVERVTGYQTSSVYCDSSLVGTFKGECNHETRFFVKVGCSGTWDREEGGC